MNEHRLHRPLSPARLVVLLGALVAIGLAAWFGYGAITRTLFERRVRAAWPAVCDALRAQQKEVVRSIEEYRTRFGTYPPDHVVSRQPLQVDPASSPLLYELAGTVLDPGRGTYTAPGLEPIPLDLAHQLFGIDRLRNHSTNAAAIGRFIDRGHFSLQEIHDNPGVGVLAPGAWPDELDPAVTREFEVTAWRYVASAPTHNPGRFDLWLEVRLDDRTQVIGNWPAAE